jgi:hypothetical protein
MEDCTGLSRQAVSLRDRVEGWAERPYTVPHKSVDSLGPQPIQSEDSRCSSSLPLTAGETRVVRSNSSAEVPPVAEKRGRGRPRKIVEPIIFRESRSVLPGEEGPLQPVTARPTSSSLSPSSIAPSTARQELKKRKHGAGNDGSEKEGSNDDSFEGQATEQGRGGGGVNTWSEALVTADYHMRCFGIQIIPSVYTDRCCVWRRRWSCMVISGSL